MKLPYSSSIRSLHCKLRKISDSYIKKVIRLPRYPVIRDVPHPPHRRHPAFNKWEEEAGDRGGGGGRGGWRWGEQPKFSSGLTHLKQ